MGPRKTRTPKFIKFIYRNKERLWLRVGCFESKYYYGYVDIVPLSKGINYNQYIKVNKNKVVETK